jgi:hypothetical protein
MLQLHDDIIRLIVSKLNFKDIIYFSILCKELYKILDAIFYENLANKLYSKKFWIKANARPVKISKPLETMKKELIRLEQFQNYVILHGFKKWTIDDFYTYWINVDDKYLDK